MSFLDPLIEIVDVKCRRPKANVASHNQRKYTVKYFVVVESRKNLICKICFLRIFAESEDFIDNLCAKKFEEKGLPYKFDL